MAYFPNGTSYYIWQEGQCDDCLNYRDNGSGSFGCAVTDAHFLMADKMHGEGGERSDVFRTLDILIPDDGPRAFECQMRLTDEMLAASRIEARQGQDAQRLDRNDESLTRKAGDAHD